MMELEQRHVQIPVQLLTWDQLEPQITALPEFAEIGKNLRGSAAVDMFYDALEKRLGRLGALTEQFRMISGVSLEEFYHEFDVSELTESDRRYVYDTC